MYLRTYSPYLDSPFTRCSESQNTIGVNLLGTLLHSLVVLIIAFVLPIYPAHCQILPCLRTKFCHIFTTKVTVRQEKELMLCLLKY